MPCSPLQAPWAEHTHDALPAGTWPKKHFAVSLNHSFKRLRNKFVRKRGWCIHLSHTASGSECPSVYRSTGRVCRSDLLGAPQESRAFGSKPGSEKLIFRFEGLPCFADTKGPAASSISKDLNAAGWQALSTALRHHSRRACTYSCRPIIARSYRP